MDYQSAKHLLRLHSFEDPDLYHPKQVSGFLGSLRPYRGRLYPENFHEVMACLQAVATELSERDRIDRDLIRYLWQICHYARLWGVHPDGMLRRNNLIAIEDVLILEAWIDCIAEVTVALLGGDTETAFAAYDHLCSESSDHFGF